MKTMQAHCGFWLLLGSLFIASTGWAAQPGVDWNNPVFTEEYVPGELLVGFKNDVAKASIQTLHHQLGAKVLRQFSITPLSHVRLPKRLSMAEAARQYAANPAVRYVEPNYIVRASATIPNDPSYGDLWGMARIRAPEAWDITQGSAEIVVGVIDTGIYATHQDLAANIAPGGYDFVNNDADPLDDQGHGTHVSGTIGAVGNNGIGVAGVNWEVKLIGLKFLDATGSGNTADAIRAVEYAATNTALKIKVTNNSWGGGGYSQGLYDAIKRAGETYGQLFIAAAGNDGVDNDQTPHYPSSYDLTNIIAVAAIGDDGALADFSCYGLESVDLAAPGVDILSTIPGAGGQYDSYSGTSMATPHVAGAVALLWSLNPDYSYVEIRNAILESVAANPALDGKMVTGGELDLFTAVAALGPQIALDRLAYQSDAAVQVTVNDPSLPAPLPASVDVVVEVRDPGAVLRWGRTNTLPAAVVGGTTFTNSFNLASGVQAVEKDTMTVTYTNSGGKSASVSVPIDDTPPVISDVHVVSVTEDLATLGWSTDEPADSRYILTKEIPPGGLAVLLPEVGGGVYVDTPTVVGGTTQYVHVVTVPVEGATKYVVAVLSEDYAGNKAWAPADLNSTNEDDYLTFITPVRRTVYENDMESGEAGWTFTNLNEVMCWEYGIPTFGSPGAYSGKRVWGTVLDGNYPHLAQAALASTPVAVKLSPRLEFESWHAFADGDFGVIEVNAGAGWVNVAALVEGSSMGWQPVKIDLPGFANQTIRVRFRIESDDKDSAAGWYIDDVRISNVLPPGINIIGYQIHDVAGGDGDGHAEPGESFFLSLEVFNSTQTQTFLNARASVTVPTPELTLTPATALVLYGDLDPGDNAFSGTNLFLSTAADVLLGTRFTLFHSATADGGQGPFADTLTLDIVDRESVHGLVTNLFTGAPIAEAWIRGRAQGYPEVLAYSGVDGSYGLHGLIPGVTYAIQALKPGEYSPSEPIDLSGPATASFGLGVAVAKAFPASFEFEVNESESDVDNLDLLNDVGDLPLVFEIEVEYLPHSAMAEVPAWLELDDPAVGVLPVGAGVSIEVTADSAGLAASEQPYEAILRLISNDVGGEDILIPVTLTVVASPILYVQSVRALGGDGDAFPEPGETVDLDILLGNSGSLYALMLEGILSYTGGGVTTVAQDTATWLDVLAGGVASPYVNPPTNVYHQIQIDPALADGAVLPFSLEVSDTNAQVATLTFALTVTVRHAISGKVSDLLTTDPVAGAVVKAVGAGFSGQALTDASGEYAIYSLTNGAYEVYVLPPAPYGAPPATIVAIAATNANSVDFHVAAWQVSALPSNIVVNLPEGVETNLTLTIKNEGVFDGFVEIGIELVEGIPHERVGQLDLPAIDWAALPAGQAVPREMLVRFEDGTALQAQASALAAVGAQVLHRYHGVPAAHVRVPGNLSLDWIANRLSADAAIRYVEPNYRRKLFAEPDDPLYLQMYGLNNVRQTDGTLGADIRAPEAWETTAGNTNVVIAVMDTGVKLDHADLAANLVPGYDFGDDDPDPSPDQIAGVEHGTHVAGTIGACGDNGLGVAGVNWNSKLMPLKVATVGVDELGLEVAVLSSDAILAALEYAVDSGVKISNHSYGGIGFSGVEYEMIGYALTNDHLFVAAAGNEGWNNDDGHPTPSYPASYNLDNIISVAATDHDDQLAYFSNFGEQSVDIAAPGVDIFSTYFYGDVDAYEKLSGTSMAAPHVAGVAGLLKSIAPWATYAMLRDAILLGSRHDPVLEGVVSSAGHLDAAGAIERIQAFWLQVAPMKGNIASLGTLPVAVKINAGGQLPTGTYVAHLVVRGGANALVVPVTVNVASAPFPVITEVDIRDGATGDGDGHAEPGETVELFIRLLNDGSALYLSPTGTLSSTTPGVAIGLGTALWPGLSSGDQQVNATAFQATMPNVEGDAEFTLTMLHPTRGPWVMPFTLPVAARHTISGRVRDAQTLNGLGGLAVEFWGASSGRVLTESNGTYRLDGLENGTYRFRVLGETHEKSAVVTQTIAGGNQTTDFLLRRPAISLGATQLVFAAQAGQDQEQELDLINPAADAFQYEILVSKPRKIGLISDRNALASIQPVLEQMGWTVSMWSNNLVTVEGVPTGLYTTDEEAILPQDLVILDLGGTAGTGRLLSATEETLLQTYLDKGGKLMVVGANVLSRPDDRRLRDLVGSDSLDRMAGTGDIAELAQALPIDPAWVAIEPGDHVAVAPMAYDEATPDTNVAPTVYFQVGAASKVMRRETEEGGVVVLWNGNKNAMEWQERGVWQDVLQGLVENELLEPVPWLNVTPATGSVSGGELPVLVKAESDGLAIGTHHALLILRGNYPGADVRAVPVVFDVVQPTLRAQSTTGVKDWMNRFLSGTGGADACLFQLVYAGPDGVVNPPAADGSATGDDVVWFTFPFNQNHGRIGVGFEWLPELGRFNEIFHHDLIETTPVRNVYVRAWDAATFGAAVAYGDSALHALDLSAYETHDFGSWVVEQVLGYPGPLASLRDSNGDSIPDGYAILNGMDPREPIGPLDANWTLQQAVGSFGTASNQFNYPTRLFLTDLFVFVLDQKNSRISVWNRQTLTHVRNYGSAGSGAGQFATPYGLGKAPNADRFAVADSANHRIQVFSFNPATGAMAFESQFGSYGSGAGKFNNPRAVAIDPLGRFYVADKDNHRVQVFDPGGNPLFSFGAFGTANGQMKSPQGIAVDEDGIIYVVDTDNNRIQGFTGGGAFLWKKGTSGTGLGQFNKPMSIQIGLGGRLYIADTSNHRIQVLDASRNPVGSLGQQGGGDGQVSFPHDVAPSFTSGAVYVADTWNHRLLKMETTLDGDGDGMDDTYELLNGLDPTDPLDAMIDTDGDGLFNVGEFRIRTNPRHSNTDGDGAPDGQEVADGTNPMDPLDFLSLVHVNTSKPFSIGWMGTAGGVYAVQASSNLPSGPAWFTVPGSIFTATVDGVVGYTNTTTDPMLFFRPVLNP
jgi:subtilisin family serine protease